MAQVFHPITNVVSKATVLGGVAGLALFAMVADVFLRSAYVTRAGVTLDQPVPFSHKHHVGELGIDCRFCHASVEDGAFAGMPTPRTCMVCHSQILADSPMLAPVRERFQTQQPLEWTRVNDLPDFVYFDHSIHVRQGVACETCHGPVHEMPLMWQHAPLHMSWCLDCHRQPERFIRPRDQVFQTTGRYGIEESAGRTDLVRAYNIETDGQALSDCSRCHR